MINWEELTVTPNEDQDQLLVSANNQISHDMEQVIVNFGMLCWELQAFGKNWGDENPCDRFPTYWAMAQELEYRWRAHTSAVSSSDDVSGYRKWLKEQIVALETEQRMARS